MSEYSVEEVRARFEAWAAFHTCLSFNRDSSGNYDERQTRTAWLAYDAAYADLREQIERAREGVRTALLKSIGGYLERHHSDNAISYDAIADHAIQSIAHLLPSGDRGEVEVPHKEEHEPDCNLNMASIKRQFMGCDCKLSVPSQKGRQPAQVADVCVTSIFSSRICERGTKSCEVHHSAQPASPEQPAGRQGEVAALPMRSAPRDGTMLRLLVRFTEHATEDAEDAWTIGANEFEANGNDEWRFAGWCWSHDHFTEGKGTPIAWLPMHDTHSIAPVGVPDGWKLVPILCTGEIAEAMIRSLDASDGDDPLTLKMSDAWDAALAAAPPSNSPTTGAIGENGK